MAPFAAARRAPSVPLGHEAPRHAVRAAGHDVAARLRALAANAETLEGALEPMLQAILDATGATAGAVCLYDVRSQALQLAAEIGLSDEGCRKLRHIARRGDGDSWGIPLHGMLNRRCYLIERAAQNRFVPPLIPDATEIETVACLPVYAGDAPLASLVLVTRMPRTLGERALHGIEAPVHEIGRAIETLRQRALEREVTPPVPASASTSVPVAPNGDEANGDAAAALPALATVDTPSLAVEIARVEGERDELAAELETLRRTACTNAEAHAAELACLRTRADAAEAGVVREQRTRAAALAEVADLRIALQRERRRVEVRTTGSSSEGATDRAPSVVPHEPRDDASTAALEEAATHVQDARAQAWSVATRLAETETALSASQEEYEARLASLTSELAALRKELAVVRAISVRTARTHARTVARQRVRDIRDVVGDLERCADAIDRLQLTGAEPLRAAAARFADVASTIPVDYGRADP